MTSDDEAMIATMHIQNLSPRSPFGTVAGPSRLVILGFVSAYELVEETEWPP